MSYTTTVTAVTGGTLTASQWNTGVRDNFTAIWVYTTAGDIAYATSASAAARLGIGTAGQSLIVNSGATAPEWGIPHGIVNDFGLASRSGTGNLTNVSWADLTSLSKTLTLTKTCTIFGVFAGTWSATSAGSMIQHIRMSINATTGNEVGMSNVGGSNIPVACTFALAGVTQGSRVVKMQNILDAGTAMVVNGVMITWAVVE